MRQLPIANSRKIGPERRGRHSITLSRFRVALAFIGVATLLASAIVTTSLYAQESTRVSKAPKPKAEALWVISNGSRYTPSVSVFQPAQQKKNGTVGSYGIWVGGTYGVWALTFDSNHDLWIGLCGEYGAGYLAELTTRGLHSLVGNGGAKFTTVITNPSATSPEYLSCPQAMQFDPAGNLWVATAPGDLLGETELLEYPSDELKSSGAPKPLGIEMPTEGLGYRSALSMAFDLTGDLWVSGYDGILEYTAAQLAAGVQTNPNQTLLEGGTFGTPDLNGPWAITFDASGNLWMTLADGGTLDTGGLEMIAASELNEVGTTTLPAAITIDGVDYGGGHRSFHSPDSLSFDSAGNLWVANAGNRGGPGRGDGGIGFLAEFTPSQLTASGTPTPVRVIVADSHSSNIGSPSYIKFGPLP